MFAVIETGGKQYRVSHGTKIKVEKLNAPKNGKVIFDKVLLVNDQEKQNVSIGSPYVKGAEVEAKIIKEGKGGRKIVFRYHSKTRYRKFKTHRQPYTEVEITKIK